MSLSREPRREESWPRAVLMSLLILFLVSSAASAQTRWSRSVHVEYNPEGAGIPSDKVNEAVRYATASWEARTGLEIQYAGLSSGAGGSDSSRITIKWTDMMGMAEQASSGFTPAATRRWFYMSSGEMASADIYLNSSYFGDGDESCFYRTIVHEIGHAIGVSTHLENRESIMYHDWDDCRYSLAVEDVEAAPYGSNLCHAELTRENDIYMPVINLDGKSYSANLKFDGALWTLEAESFREVPHQPQCRTVTASGTDLILRRLWSLEQDWHAELEHVEGETWALRSARALPD